MGALNLTGIKNGIKSVLDTANDALATYDLSTSMNRRVQQIITYSPLSIAPQASYYPLVAIEVDTKNISHQAIAKNQANAKRRADVIFNIYGITWEPITTNISKDAADDQVEQLMENIEVILRADYTLNSTVDYYIPLNVRYHSAMDEETHYRAGIYQLQASVYY